MKKLFFYVVLISTPVACSLLLVGLAYQYLRYSHVTASEYWICYTCPSSSFKWKGAIGAPREFEASITTNELGYNDKPLAYRADAENKVLVLGDSFVESLQVDSEQSFGSLVEQRHPDTRIYRVGRSGWGQKDVNDFLDSEAHQSFSANKVVLTYFYHNDLWNNDETLREHLLGDPSGNRPRPKSHLANAAVRKNDFLAYVAYYTDLYNRIAYSKANPAHTEWAIYRTNFMHGSVMAKALDTADEYFRAVKRKLKTAYGIRDQDIYVLIIPTKYYFDALAQKKEVLPSGIPQDHYRYDLLHTMIKDRVAKLFDAANVIDLGEHIGCGHASTDIYFRADGHWNGDGHRTVACAFETNVLKR